MLQLTRAENRRNSGSDTQETALDESQAVSGCSTKNCQEPNQPTEEARETTRALGGKLKRFMQVTREGGECGVVRESFEQLTDVGNPEWPLEAGANVVPTLRKAQCVLLGLAKHAPQLRLHLSCG